MVSQYSKNKSQAIEFIKFATSLEMQKLFYEISGYYPVRREIYSDSAFFKQNSNLKYYAKLFERGKHRPVKDNYTKISDIMSYYFHQALERQISVQQALNLATEKINSKQAFLR